MKFIPYALCIGALLIASKHSHAQNASETANHSHNQATSAAVSDAPKTDPLRDAGVVQTERVAALSAIAKSASISIAAATLSEIEACDACLARNDLATILAAQPAADLKALAPTLVRKANESTKDAIKDAANTSESRFVKAACGRAIFALPENERPIERHSYTIET